MLWLYLILGLIAFLIIIYLISLLVIFKALSSRYSKRTDVFDNNFMHKSIKKNYTGLIQEQVKTLKEYDMDAIHIESKDHLKLTGYYYHVSKPKAICITCHGYHSDPYLACGVFISKALKKDHDVLAIDQRSHGNSEGSHITFGLKESEDLLLWIEYLSSKFSLPIYIYGISMGGLACCLAASSFPDNVKLLIADCAPKSIESTFKHFLSLFHLPTFLYFKPLVYLCKKYADFNPLEGDADKSLKESQLPIIFIHGTKDRIVPYKMGLENFISKGSNAKFIKCEGADHAVGYLQELDKCEQIINEYLKKLVG